MDVTLRYRAEEDVLDARFDSGAPTRRVQLATGTEAAFDGSRRLSQLTIEHFSRFHDFVPLGDAIGVEGITAISQFQIDALQGRRRRTVTLNPKPLSRRKLDHLTAA